MSILEESGLLPVMSKDMIPTGDVELRHSRVKIMDVEGTMLDHCLDDNEKGCTHCAATMLSIVAIVD